MNVSMIYRHNSLLVNIHFIIKPILTIIHKRYKNMLKNTQSSEIVLSHYTNKGTPQYTHKIMALILFPRFNDIFLT